MKKLAWIVARKNIIDPQTMRVHDDNGLRALDGIIYGKPKEFDESISNFQILDLLIKEFESQYPRFRNCNYELVTKELGEE